MKSWKCNNTLRHRTKANMTSQASGTREASLIWIVSEWIFRSKQMFNSVFCLHHYWICVQRGPGYLPELQQRKEASHFIVNDKETVKLETFCLRWHKQELVLSALRCRRNQRALRKVPIFWNNVIINFKTILSGLRYCMFNSLTLTFVNASSSSVFINLYEFCTTGSMSTCQNGLSQRIQWAWEYSQPTWMDSELSLSHATELLPPFYQRYQQI